MMRLRLAVLALTLLVTTPAAADQLLPPGRIVGPSGNGDIQFGPLRLGKRQGGKTIIQPDALDILGPGSTGPVDGMSVGGRSLAARAREEINALDYGLVCDGVTDNKDAIARIRTAIQSGTTVFFPPAGAKCMTTRPLSVVGKSNVTIRAVPGTVTIGALPGIPGKPLLLGVSMASDVSVYGLGFDGGGETYASSEPVTEVYQSDNVVFDAVTVQATRGIGTSFSRAKFSGVRNSTYRDIGNGWKVTKITTDRSQAITFCCTEPGKEPADYPGNFAHGNVITTIGLDPISFGNAANVSAVGNRCEMGNSQLTDPSFTADAYAGCIYTTIVTGATITGNTIVGATGNAIDIHETTGFTVSGNYIIGSGQAGIGVFGSYGSVSGNTILDSGGWTASPYRAGIALAGPLNGVSIQGNLIADTRDIKAQPYGIQGASGSCPTCLIANNSIVGMATAEFGGYLSGPTALTAKAGGTGLTGGAWTAWVPNLTATGGTGVTYGILSAAYEQTGKTLRGRMTIQVNDTGARPSEISFGLPGGQTMPSGAVGSAVNLSTGATLQLASNGATALRLRPLTPGGPFLDGPGQYLALSFEVEVQ